MHILEKKAKNQWPKNTSLEVRRRANYTKEKRIKKVTKLQKIMNEEDNKLFSRKKLTKLK